MVVQLPIALPSASIAASRMLAAGDFVKTPLSISLNFVQSQIDFFSQ
jgi:hypothetical protein